MDQDQGEARGREGYTHISGLCGCLFVCSVLSLSRVPIGQSMNQSVSDSLVCDSLAQLKWLGLGLGWESTEGGVASGGYGMSARVHDVDGVVCVSLPLCMSVYLPYAWLSVCVGVSGGGGRLALIL